jgi:hypothetical protein
MLTEFQVGWTGVYVRNQEIDHQKSSTTRANTQGKLTHLFPVDMRKNICKPQSIRSNTTVNWGQHEAYVPKHPHRDLLPFPRLINIHSSLFNLRSPTPSIVA